MLDPNVLVLSFLDSLRFHFTQIDYPLRQTARALSIHDWEIGTLFWNCLRQSDGDEEAAKALVRQKYFDDFVTQKDILLFLGTTYEFHKRRMDDPFIITGVFYPPKTQQLSLFTPSA